MGLNYHVKDARANVIPDARIKTIHHLAILLLLLYKSQFQSDHHFDYSREETSFLLFDYLVIDLHDAEDSGQSVTCPITYWS